MAFVQNTSQRKIQTFNLDPRTKLVMLFFLSLLSFMISNYLIQLFMLNLMLIFAVISNINFKSFFKYIKPTLWLLPIIFIIQLAFNNSSSGNTFSFYVEFGFLSNIVQINYNFITINIDSLLLAVNSSLRIVNLAIGSVLFSVTTNSNDYLQSLTKIGFPFELAFTTGLVIYFLPMVISETAETRIALEIRGVSITQGTFISRIKAFKILATSILINFIEKSKYQAIALDSRGFKSKGKRTYYRKIKLQFIDVIMIVFILSLVAGICYISKDELRNFFIYWIGGTS
ncbi:MAG: energy-coupling factor transporter transmembrane protein EcfT [Candidatus Heimdallarchaeota archaeon]|nr:energy-coupling factor transporter transmembrane protein EcfT [Candidatus Heimdallarchaeota archaeon]